MALNADPRLIGETAHVQTGSAWPTSLTETRRRISNPYRLPETPPPKTPAA